MKLYTEEQVKIAYSKGNNDGYYGIQRDFIGLNLMPIELPSDEEIGLIALNIASTLKDGLDSREEAFYLAGFQTCAKWMKEEILNQNK
jgi:hypothetical protein